MYETEGIGTNWHLVKYLQSEDNNRWDIGILKELVKGEVLKTYINKN